MKRDFSDMESECDDVFGEEASKGTPTQSSESCQILNKKKRRGVIEKRRRDRINSSLSELRRLVPAAFEKQGSAKLEKAEILQMTVDHLKMLHAKGFDAFSFDPHKYAADYHSLGFRECATEVARYLVAIEGMDLQDPLRLRLMSHLQSYSAQREFVIKPSASHSPWNPPTPFSSVPPPTPQYPPPPVATLNAASIPTSSITAMEPSNASYTNEDSRFNHTYSTDSNLGSHSAPHVTRVTPTYGPSSSLPSSTMNASSSPMVPTLGQMPVNQYLASYGLPSANYGPSGGSQFASVRPYRPWGSEFAY